MAVTTWTAGQVLTAADLNDTLASKLPYSYGTATPSTTDSGFLWYDSNSTPPVTKYWNGSSFATLAPAPGLELVSADAFSSVSAVNVNGCFTSDYQRYRVSFDATNSGPDYVDIRLRASGSDVTTNTYSTQRVTIDGASQTLNRTNSTNRFDQVTFSATSLTSCFFDILNPAAAAGKYILSFSVFNTTSPRYWNAYGYNSTATSVDGFSLLAVSGTISGTVRVYGYKD